MPLRPRISFALIGLCALATPACSGRNAVDTNTSTVAGGGARLSPANRTDAAAIRKTLGDYNEALNAGRTSAVMPLYARGAIFMPPYSPSAIGADAIGKAYDAVFRELKFNVKFNVAELVQMAPTWAYVRTNSAGTTHHASTGRTGAEANQELFLFRKEGDGVWRIARYSFSPTSPPAPHP